VFQPDVHLFLILIIFIPHHLDKHDEVNAFEKKLKKFLPAAPCRLQLFNHSHHISCTPKR